MSEKLYKLPESDEIVRRLNAVENTAYIAEKVIPVIAENFAGQEGNPQGILNAVVMSIGQSFQDNTMMINIVVLNSTPIYLDALVDDKEFLREVMEIFEDMKRRFGTKTIEPKQG